MNEVKIIIYSSRGYVADVIIFHSCFWGYSKSFDPQHPHGH